MRRPFGIAAPMHGLPVRLDRAPQRGAAFALTRDCLRARPAENGLPGAIPAQVGDGWRVFIHWASGRIQYISGFVSVQDAEEWIASEAHSWLNALDTQL
jgi:hypothetical protein